MREAKSAAVRKLQGLYHTSSHEHKRGGDHEGRVRLWATRALETEHIMDSLEAQARATIAAALITRGAVEVPSLPPSGEHLPDAAGVRLRDLTDYVYRLITTADSGEPL